MTIDDEAARERARGLLEDVNRKAPFRVPDHGQVKRAADGTLFVECVLELEPEPERDAEGVGEPWGHDEGGEG